MAAQRVITLSAILYHGVFDWVAEIADVSLNKPHFPEMMTSKIDMFQVRQTIQKRRLLFNYIQHDIES